MKQQLSTMSGAIQIQKERKRGPNLAILAKCPMEEALSRADSGGFVLASNRRLSQELVGNCWVGDRQHFCAWSGTMVAYVEPGKKLGRAVEYTDRRSGVRYVFPVPQEHQEKRDAVLVAEHPDYLIETEGNTRIIRPSAVDIVENFAACGWFAGDPKHDIPQGTPSDQLDPREPGARMLFREGRRVGLIYRIFFINECSRHILMGSGPSADNAAVVESAEMDERLEDRSIN